MLVVVVNLLARVFDDPSISLIPYSFHALISRLIAPRSPLSSALGHGASCDAADDWLSQQARLQRSMGALGRNRAKRAEVRRGGGSGSEEGAVLR